MQGILKVITGTNPAAGNEISHTVPSGKRWRLLAARFALVTDATVASRFVAFKITDGTNTLFEGYATAAVSQTASLTYNYSASPILDGSGSSGTKRVIPIPMILLGSGYTAGTSTTAIQSGDNYGAPVFLVEEYDEELGMPTAPSAYVVG